MYNDYVTRDPEHQNNEWKSSWQDEYFKWLCGYANVGGGHLFVGVVDRIGQSSNVTYVLKDH